MDPSSFGKRGQVLALLLFCLLSAVLSGCGGDAKRSFHVASPAYSQPAGYPQQPAADSATTGRTETETKNDAPPPAAPERTMSTASANKPAESSGGFMSLFGGSKAEAKAQTAAPPPPPQAPPPAPGPAPKADPTQQAAQQRELIIYTARVTMAVYQVDQGVASVEKIANESGGYLATKQDRGITIRVPRGRFQDTLAKIDKIGDVLHRDVQAQDVTDEHLDLEIRIKNARAMRTRLQDLLAKANVKEALEIEKELHRVTEELERLEGKLKLLADKVAYSTITVAFEARGTQIRAASVRLPFPWLTQVGLPGLLQLNEEK